MRSLLIAGNVLRRILSDRRTVLLVLLTPLLFVLLYGTSFSSRHTHLTIAVVDKDNGLASVRTAEIGRVTLSVHLASRLLTAVVKEGFPIIKETRVEDAEEAVRSGGAWAAIVFPAGFSNAIVNEALRLGGERTMRFEGREVRLLPPETTLDIRVTLFVDDSNPLISSSGLAILQQAFSDIVSDQQRGLSVDAMLDLRPIYDGEITNLDYTAPGIIAFAITLISVMLTAVSIVRERTGGTLTRILVAPVRSAEIVTGYAAAFTVVAGIQAVELVAVSRFAFGIRLAGSVALVALILFLFVLGLQGLATLLSTIARNEFQAMQLVLILLIPSIMLGGVFWPPEALPPSLRALAQILPLTHANEALREVMLAGRGISAVTVELSALVAFAVATLAAGTWSMRRQLRRG
ncbi:MAG: ABC transporter permease [Candidatus Bipolaricaulota bacterium]|nr:MAG: ABC transporter permease [Candidatus Bipolaricaulota bacterium]